MKRIVAFIKPNMLDDVIFALHEMTAFPGASISDARDIGIGERGKREAGDSTPLHTFMKMVRMEIVCPQEIVEKIVGTIRDNAHTGRPDDGKIYISPVEDALRIGSGERGDSAV